ncbi:MAG: hypothetical protein GY718_18130, partial [Lentisphaerae bacterium]|nr:hypothetical protein [Lentisphaerota bacterium]
MPKDFRPFFVLIGGGTGSLDKWPAAMFEDLDPTFGQTDGIFYSYSFDASATNAESSPMYIRPDDNAFPAAGVHVLQSIGCNNLTLEGGSIQLKEQSAAQSSTAEYGQLWIKDDAPNVLKFTDDAGTDFDMSLSGHTHTESDVTDLQSYLLNLSGSPLSELSDVTITSIAAGEVLKWTGAAWINNTLAEAGIGAAVHTHTESDITDLQSYLTSANELGTNLSSATNDIASDTGIIELKGTGNTNNENLLLDFETVANEVGISSSTGVTNFNFTGTIELEPTTSSTTGVIYKGADRFIHSFSHPTGDTVIPDGNNLFMGIGAGNFTMGSTATSSAHGSYNSFIGANSGYSNTTGYQNNFMGFNSGYKNTTGYYNNFIGANSGYWNTSGYYNNFIGYASGYRNASGHSNNFTGYFSGYSNTTGYFNNFMGYVSGYSNTTGYFNNFMGYYSGNSNTTGHSNNFIGNNSGRYYNGTTGANTTSDYCTLIGNSTSVSADGVQRETVLGYNAIGKGSDTAIIGAEATNDRVYLSGGLTVNDAGADYDTNIATVAGANSL